MTTSDAFREQLESGLVDRYTIQRELTGGGFARVFLATETTLARQVVIKALSPELSASISAKRFEREIRLAAALQQANIVPLLAAGEAAGVPYYAMPFVEGLSLRERLTRDSALSIAQTVSILRDVTRALVYAHERGIVHRDIKPENVLLSGDAAVVTDFGIAKAISDAASQTSGAPNVSTVTQPGTAVGTPMYMAPEQLSGDPGIDHRADLYSLGCLAYELLAGQPPFAGSLQALFAGHLSERPKPVSERRSDCPPALAQIVMQCLEKDPVTRPPNARAVLRVLDAEMRPATGLTRLGRRLDRRQRIAVGVALATVSLGGALTLASGTFSGRAAVSSVAVIPFLNLSGDSTDEYLADGIADEVATALGKLPGVRVVSRSLSYRFKGQRAIDATIVGRELDCEHLVQGTIRRTASGLRVSAQLISVDDNSETWSESYVRNVADALVFQDSITLAIAGELHRELSDGAAAVVTAALGRGGTTSPEAYDLYLRGRFLLQRRGPGVRQAIANFEDAIAQDSSFARAHAALALALELLPYFEPVSARAVKDRAVAAAERALRADSTLADAHTALAMAFQHDYEWQRADTTYRRAIALDSLTADQYIQYGRLLYYTGRFAEAQLQFEEARRLDPYSAVASGWVGHMLDLSGQPRAALTELSRALEIDSTNPPLLVFAAELLNATGRREDAAVLLERLWRVVPVRSWQGVAAAYFASFGAPERAMGLIQELRREPPGPITHTQLAMLHLSVGDTAQALDALERATDAREIWPTYYSLSERFFDPLRSSRRFAAIVQRVGLDASVFTSPNGGRPE